MLARRAAAIPERLMDAVSEILSGVRLSGAVFFMAAFWVNDRSDRSGQWLDSSILHLVEEPSSGRVGSEAMLAKLSEALLVDTLRRYAAGLPEHQMGWLAGTRDPVVGKSLGLLHSRI